MIENVSIVQFALGVFTQGKLYNQLINKRLHFTTPPNVSHVSEAEGRTAGGLGGTPPNLSKIMGYKLSQALAWLLPE